MANKISRVKTPRANLLRGVILLCRGKAAGFSEIGAGPQDFLSSLAPMIAFPLVGTVLMLSSGRWREAATDFMAALCAVLAPPVLSYVLARRWGREEQWFRFATAFNWCQWVLPLLVSLLVLASGVMVQGGLSPKASIGLLACILLAYAFWLHWFLARHGLDLSKGRAALLVFMVNLGTIILVAGPQLIQLYLFGSHAA
jgi:hypothetical protein